MKKSYLQIRARFLCFDFSTFEHFYSAELDLDDIHIDHFSSNSNSRTEKNKENPIQNTTPNKWRKKKTINFLFSTEFSVQFFRFSLVFQQNCVKLKTQTFLWVWIFLSLTFRFFDSLFLYYFYFILFFFCVYCKSRKISTQQNGGHLESKVDVSEQIDRELCKCRCGCVQHVSFDTTQLCEWLCFHLECIDFSKKE